MGNTWHSHYVGTPFLKIAHHSNMICCAQRLNWMIHFWLFTLMPNKGLESTTKNRVGRVVGNTDCFVWPNLNFRGYFHIYTHKCNTPAWLMHPRGSNAIHMCYIVSWLTNVFDSWQNSEPDKLFQTDACTYTLLCSKSVLQLSAGLQCHWCKPQPLYIHSRYYEIRLRLKS